MTETAEWLRVLCTLRAMILMSWPDAPMYALNCAHMLLSFAPDTLLAAAAAVCLLSKEGRAWAVTLHQLLRREDRTG